MARRRLTLRTYLRRRWRVAGFLGVLFLGAVLILVLTDRGHDPLWSTRAPYVDQLAVAPDGSIVYALVRADENGPIVQLEAHDGATGATLWRTDMNDTGALLAADDGGVAVATDFPRAFATYYGKEGRPRYQVPLEGEPRALTVDRARIAVALQTAGGGDRVVLLENGAVVRDERFGSYVNALDARAQRLAVGTSDGDVVLLAANGTVLHNRSIDISVLSLRLSADAQALVVGGYNLNASAGFAGGVAFFDFTNETPLRWIQRTDTGVGLVDLDGRGDRAIAIEESTPRHRLHAYDTRAAVEDWGKLLGGLVGRDDAGRGGAGLSPDGAVVVVGTLRGSLRAFDGADGSLLWSYASDGTTAVAFRQTTPPAFAANARLVTNGPLEGILYFATGREPLGEDVPALAAMMGLGAVVVGLAVLGAGYWRLRRS